MNRPTFWPDAQQTLLLHAVLDEPERAQASVTRWLATIDFETIDAGSQRLLPLLDARLKLLRIEHPLTARIRGIFRRNWYFEQRIRRHLRVVRTIFRDGGIECILLKGTALGLDVYGRGAFRPADDIDLLVRIESMEAAVGQLVRAGWRVGTIGGAAGPHARIMHSDICSLDLHISPFHERLRDADIQPLWEDKREIIFDGADADLLSLHDQLLHILVHGLRVNRMPPIRWVADAVFMLRRYGQELDWDRFVSRAETLAYTLVASRGLAYLATEFGAPVPESVLDRLARHRKGMLERIEFREREGRRKPPLAYWILWFRNVRNLSIDTRPASRRR